MLSRVALSYLDLLVAVVKDNLPMPIYEATKRCVEAFRLKDEDLMKSEFAVFIQYQIDMYVYNRLLNVW